LFERGTYVLVLELTRQRTVRVGSLGRIRFAGGYYAYVGSARKGMRSRVARHLAREKRKRWHIDWLTTLPAAVPTAVACTQRTGVECRIASALSNRADLQVEGFGCSDCECGSHLFHFSDAGAVSLALQALVKYGVTVEWLLHRPPDRPTRQAMDSPSEWRRLGRPCILRSSCGSAAPRSGGRARPALWSSRTPSGRAHDTLSPSIPRSQ
jgi:Uri superfamily endonuclease